MKMKITKDTLAYDYDAQRWIDGYAGLALRRTQLTEDLELLQSAQGADYAKFINVDRMAAIVRIQALLK
jgi:hypothetical protein